MRIKTPKQRCFAAIVQLWDQARLGCAANPESRSFKRLTQSCKSLLLRSAPHDGAWKVRVAAIIALNQLRDSVSAACASVFTQQLLA
jgi:hypothetical protein